MIYLHSWVFQKVKLREPQSNHKLNYRVCETVRLSLQLSTVHPLTSKKNVARNRKCCRSWTFGGKQFVCWMWYDHESTNERARCIEKNSSYITKTVYKQIHRNKRRTGQNSDTLTNILFKQTLLSKHVMHTSSFAARSNVVQKRKTVA